MADIKDIDLMILLSHNEEEVKTKYWQRVDLDKNTSFSFNFQASEITDPTATKIPFSSSINLPRTKLNEEVFSNIEVYNANLVNMNAIERTEFRLYINNNIYQHGYFKLENVTLKEYKIRLYGGLGDFFYELSDTSKGNSNDMYIRNLPFGTQFDHKINRSYVLANWNMNSLTGSTTSAANGENQFFGYAMTYQGPYNNFDSKTEVNGAGDDFVNEVTWTSIKDNKTYSEPELTEHRRNFTIRNSAGTITNNYAGHYVSYYQRPMIRLQTIINKIKDRMVDKNWDMVLDTTFFNDSNPYWGDTWVLLPQYSTNGNPTGVQIKFDNFPTSPSNSSISGDWNRSGYGDQDVFGFTSAACRTACNMGSGYENSMSQGYVGPDVSGALPITSYHLTFNQIDYDNSNAYTFNVNVPFFVRWVNNTSTTSDARRWKSLSTNTTNTGNPVNIRCYLKIGNKRVKEIAINNGQLNLTNATCDPQNHIRQRNFYNMAPGNGGWNNYKVNNPTTYIAQDDVPVPAGRYSGAVSIEFTISGDTGWFVNGSGRNRNNYGVIIRPLKTGFIGYSDSGGIGIRSGSDITYSKILQSDETCFQFLMSFCKTFGMYFVKDPYQKKVTIMTRNTYYGLQERLDWTYKIDYSKEWNEGIANFDYKIGLLKWRDTDSKYEQEYLDVYGKEYGSLRVNTNYGFSDIEKDYFSENIFSNCVIANYSEEYFLGRTDTLYQDNKTLPFLQDKAGNGITSNFILVFREFPRSQANRSFIVSDDSDLMLSYGYSWIGPGLGTSLYTTGSYYPTIRRTITKNNEPYSLYFGSPSKVYNDYEGSGFAVSTEGEGTIYKRFWATYLRDRFDRNTKTLTCYVDLDINDIQTDLFRKFIFINDTCWVLNKITNFNPLTPGPTKCELVKVQNISNYLGQKYIAGRFWIQYPANGTVIFDSKNNIDDTVVRLNSSSQTISFTFNQSQSLTQLGWSIEDVEGLRITPMNSTNLTQRVEVTLPKNNTGSVKYYYVPVRWGNSTTILTLVQVSNWTVNTSVGSGTATTNASGGGESGTSILVEEGTSVTLTTTSSSGEIFGYWTINGEINTNQTIILTVSDNINAIAYWFDADSFGWDESNMNISEEGGILNNTLKTQTNVIYNITSSPSISFFPNSGDRTQDIEFTIPENTTKNEITYTITATFSNGLTSTFTIIQEAIKYIDISPTSANIDSNENTITVTVDSNTDWTVTGDAGLTISPTSGSGQGTVQITVPANFDLVAKFYSVTFSTADEDKTLVISQAGFVPQISIDPEEITINGNSNSYVIAVTSNTDWTVYVDPIYDAYFYVSPLSGSGNAQVTVTIAPNTGSTTRVGEATFKTTIGDLEVDHIITQTAGVSSAYVNLLNESGAVITPSSDFEIILKNANGTIVDQYTVTSIPTGSTRYEFANKPIGNYTIELSDYTGNTSSSTVWNALPATSQSVEIVADSINGVTYGFSVDNSRTLVLTPDTVTVGSLLNNFSLQLIASDGLSWTITDNANWLSCSPSSGTGSATINVTVAANLLQPRTGVITATSTSGTPVISDICNVNQTGIL